MQVRARVHVCDELAPQGVPWERMHCTEAQCQQRLGNRRGWARPGRC